MAASTQTKPVGRALRRNAWWGGVAVAVAVAVAAVSLTVDGRGPLFIPAFGIGAASLGLAVTTFLERWQLTRRARRELALLNRERVAGGELAWGPAEMEQYIAAAVGEEISGGWDTPYSGGMPRRRLGYRPGHTRLTRRVLVGGGPEVAALASEVELDLALDRRMRSRGSGPLIDGHTTTVVVQRPSVFGRELGLRLGDEVRAVLRVPMFGWTARGEVAGRAVRIELQQGVIRDDRTGEEIAQLRRGKLLAFDGVAASWKYLGPREGFAFVAQDGQPLLHARLKPGWRRSAELQVDGGMAEWQALVTALVATYLLVQS